MTHAWLTDPTALWEHYRPTPLLDLPELARLTRVGRVLVKVEGERPLGNFKVLGGMVAGLRALARAVGAATLQDLLDTREERSAWPHLICASDGNHGLAVAAAAQRAGTRAAIYLPTSVSPQRAARIEALGASVVWIQGTYDTAVCEAANAAARGEGLLIADTTTDPHDAVVHDVMAGYGLLTQELTAQFRDEVGAQPSHVFVQAGVGGLAAAVADGLRGQLRTPSRLLVVEPEAAACVARALAEGHPVAIEGDLHTAAEMLACGLASAPALAILQRHGAQSVVVPETSLQAAVAALRAAGGPDTTPSGATGLAGLLHIAAHAPLRAQHQLDQDSCVLLIASEGSIAEDALTS